MPRPPKTTEDAERRALEIIAATTDVEQLRHAQAFLLPLQGLTLKQTGKVIGRDSFWVSRARNRFIRGEQMPTTHGGRRNAYFTVKQEHEFMISVLREWDELSWPEQQQTPLRAYITDKLHKLTRSTVAESTITDMLDRLTRHYLPSLKWSDHRAMGAALVAVSQIERDREAWINTRKRLLEMGIL